jgi:hypothetical protein
MSRHHIKLSVAGGMTARRNGMGLICFMPEGRYLPCLRSLTVENTQTGERFEDDADVLVSARGNLNDIAWPKIPGFDTFEGEIMHSAAWNEE